MKSAIIAAATVASCSAFAPTPVAQTSTSLAATAAQTDFFGLVEEVDFTKEVGVLPPVSFVSLSMGLDDIIFVYINACISPCISLLIHIHMICIYTKLIYYCN